jgi:ABC-type transport system involved in multi-copper enzyme maturation permease subunit
MLTLVLDTIRETVRRKFVPAAAILTAAATLLSLWGFWSLAHLHTAAGRPISFVEMRSTTAVLVIFGGFLFSFVLAFGAAVLAAPALSTDLESGLLLPILARPIPRQLIVVSKIVGLAIVLGIYAAVASVLELCAVYVTTGYIPPNPPAAIVALWGVSVVVLSLTIALSVRLPALATSLVAVMGFGVAWMVGIVAAFANAYHNATLERVGVISQLLLPTDAMWRLAAYQLEPVAMLGRNGGFGPLGPFSVASPPPPAMAWWAAAWCAGIICLASWMFARRDA